MPILIVIDLLRPVVITISTKGVRKSIRTFQNQAKQDRSSLPVVYGLVWGIINEPVLNSYNFDVIV